MFCSPAVRCCGGLHSIGITRLLRYTGLHPKILVLCLAAFLGCFGILLSVLHRRRTLRSAWFILCLNVLLDAVGDPGEEFDHSSYRNLPCCLLQLRKLRPSRLRVFRGYLPDSASIASPRNLPPLPASDWGGLTKTFPRGIPTHTTKNHFQVQPQPALLT